MRTDAHSNNLAGPAAPLARAWNSLLQATSVQVVGAQLALLAVAVLRNWDQLNHDAVAYLRIARYYATGRLDLAITGYWSPLLSWLMTPLSAAGLAPLSSARLVMMLSAVVFLIGCDAVLRQLSLDSTTRSIGRWLAAVNGVFWSVRFTTPDLLAAGLFLGAVALLLDERWTTNRRVAFASGMLAGLSYVAKAAYLPQWLLTAVGLTIFCRRWSGRRPHLAAAAGVTSLGLVLVAGPWIGVLTAHYGRFTISTTARLALALAAPPEFNQPQPSMSTLHQPDAGRITSWEEPSKLKYPLWSPFASSANFRHQLAIFGRDALAILWMLARFDVVGLGLIGTAFLVGTRWRRRRETGREDDAGRREARPAWPIVALVLVYLPFPVVAENQRFFYAALPFLWVCGRRAAEILPTRWPESRPATRARGIVTASFVGAALLWLGVALYGWPRFAPAGSIARQLATRMARAQLQGPLAGSALMRGGRVGLYAAFFLDQPWLGDEPDAPLRRWRESGARFVILRRDDPRLAEFSRDHGFADLDRLLFASGAEAAAFPVKVFAVRPDTAAPPP